MRYILATSLLYEKGSATLEKSMSAKSKYKSAILITIIPGFQGLHFSAAISHAKYYFSIQNGKNILFIFRQKCLN